MKKQKTECCEKCVDCKKLDDYKNPTRIYFCPKCKSREVGYVFRFGNAFGIIPKMECKKCKNSAQVFPQIIFEGDKAHKINKPKKRKKK